MRKKTATIDEYLATLEDDRRLALGRLRKTLRSLLPAAEECISYGIPAFRLDGNVVAGFCATGKGCSYFPFSGTTLKTLASELHAYEQTKSSLHFSPTKGLATPLVRKLLKARIAETKRRDEAPRRSASDAKAEAHARRQAVRKRSR